jgi:Cdc6-like AAA superfamily ATPase
MADETTVARSSSDEDASHALDVERTAWESAREHDNGTGSPQATTGELQGPSKD